MADDDTRRTRRFSDSSSSINSLIGTARGDEKITIINNSNADISSYKHLDQLDHTSYASVRSGSSDTHFTEQDHHHTKENQINLKNTSAIQSKQVTCVINRRLRNHKHLFHNNNQQFQLSSAKQIAKLQATLMTTNMKPIKFIKSSLLLTIVIISLVIVASIALAAPPKASVNNAEIVTELSSASAAAAATSKQQPLASVVDSLKPSSSSSGESPKAEVSANQASAADKHRSAHDLESIEPPKKAPTAEAVALSSQDTRETNSESNSRQSRAVDSSTASSAANSAESSPAQKTSTSSKKALDTSSEPAASPSIETKSSSSSSNSQNKSSSSSKSSLSPKSSSSSSSKSSQSASSGSAGSNGGASPSHYVSKHDSYSAIAERHLFADAMRKSDKRRLQSSSMEHSSKLGDMLSSLKDVTNNGFSRSIGASVRSILKSKYSVPAYVASALLGAVALMAFYESPISPLPVPSLPEPPIGRFPPEMPSLPVNTQVPFRYNGNNQQRQEQYVNAYQRMHQQPQQQQQSNGLTGPKGQQFSAGPAAHNQQAYSAGSVSFPGQQSNGQQQQHQPDVAQRKSSLDYEPVVSSRSFFGGGSAKLAASASGGTSSTLNQRIGTMGNQPLDYLGDNILNGYGYHHSSASESKGAAAPADVLSNSHVINKFKSYFSRAPAQSPTSSGSSSASSSGQTASKPVNPYEQYQKMSLIQALIKDTSFLPAFMTGNANKVSAPSSAASSSAASNNKVKNQGGNTLSERMITTSSSHNGGAQFNYNTDSLQSPSKQHSPSSSGIMKAADKIAHALLETLTTSLQRHSTSPSQSNPVSSSAVVSSKSSNGDQMNSRKSPSSDSDLSPMETNPSAANANDRSSKAQSKASSSVAATDNSSAASSQSTSYQSDSLHVDHSSQSVANSRSDDSPDLVVSANKQTSESKSPSQQASQSSPSSSSSLSRKTRSVDQHISKPQKPSTAANINHVIDYVSDSYAQNRLLFSTILHQVGLGQATHYMDSLLIGSTNVH